jgi:hypothetical protein
MLKTEFSIPISVEVSFNDVMRGIFEIEGLLNYAEETLTIEYQTKELLSRTSSVATVDLSLDALREIVYKQRIIGASIILRPRRLSAFEEVPLSTNAQIVLLVKRADRKEAEALVSHVQRVITYRNTPVDASPIPFRVPDVGLRKIKGTLYLEHDEFLVFNVENALIGHIDSKRELIKIAPRALKNVRLDERRSHDRLYIQPKSPNLLEAMPGSYKDELELKVDRKYRNHVERLVYELTRLSSQVSAPENEPSGAAGHSGGEGRARGE